MTWSGTTWCRSAWLRRESSMSNFFNFDISQLILWLPAVIIALTFHEYAHG